MNRNSFIFCFIFLTLFASACSTSQNKASNALEAASFVEAETIAREELKTNPQDAQLKLVLAESLSGQKKYLDAHPIAEELSTSLEDPKKSESIPIEIGGRINQVYGKIEWELGRTLKAAKAWGKARSFDENLVPKDQYIRAIETAILYAESKFNFDAALELREELGRLDPQNPEAIEEKIRKTKEARAASLERNGKYEDAILAYKELSEQYPENHELLFSMGHLQAIMRDRRADAEETFNKYINLGTSNERIKRTLEVANRLESLNSNELAIKFYQKVAEEKSVPKTDRKNNLLTLARLHFATGAETKAERRLNDYIQLSNLDAIASPRPYIKVAEIAVAGKKPLVAVKLLEVGTKKANPNWRLSRLLADLYSRRGKTKDAERILELYIKRSIENETDAAKKASRYIDVGRWAAGRRKYKLAKFFYEKAIVVKDVDELAFLELSKIYAALGYLSELRRTMKLYIAKGNKATATYLSAASVYESQRMYDEAEKMYLMAIKQKDSDFSTVRSLETLYRTWGKPKKISEVFEKWIKSRGGKPKDHLMIGERFYRQANWDSAEKYLKLAAEGGQNEAWIALADIYKRNQDGARMKDAIDNYLKNSTQKTLALNEAARRYVSSRWTDNAIPIYEELITLQPRTFSNYKSLSEIYFSKDKNEKATEVLKKYIDQSTKKAAAMETIQRSYSRPQYAVSIISLFERVMEAQTDPDPAIYKILGDAYQKAERGRLTRPTMAQNVFFIKPNKAKLNYKLYLEKGTPPKTSLRSFASRLTSLNYWDLAALAYEKMEIDDETSAPILFDFGTVLLHIGESEKAEKTFARYFEKRKESVDAAQRIAEQLYANNRLKTAQPYLERMLESSNEGMKKAAFIQLVNVFIATDQSEKISKIANTYIEEAQNPAQARQTLLTTLQNRGLWNLASNQLEKMIKDNSDELSFQLAGLLFTQGRDDEVRETLNGFASEHVNQVDAWVRVANFYATRGWNEDAENAFSNASQNSANENDQRSLHALFEFAKFNLQTGDVDAGQAKFKEGRKRLPQAQKESHYFTEISILMKMGYYKRAQEVAQEALPSVFSGKAFLFSALNKAQYGDTAEKKQRRLDLVKAAGLGLRETVSLLVRNGLYEDAIDAIDKVSKTGDQRIAAEVIAENARIFLDVGGLKRLFQSAQPLLDSNQDNLFVPLSSILMLKGEYRRAIILLKRANAKRVPIVDELLAECYLHIGDFERAFEHVQNDMLSSADSAGTLRGFGTKADNTNHKIAFQTALKQLSDDATFSQVAFPYFIARLLEEQKITDASDEVRRSWNEVETNPVKRLSQSLKIKAAIEQFAISGFAAEALFLMKELPEALQKDPAIIELNIALSAFEKGPEGDSILLSKIQELENSPVDNGRKLTLAKFAIASQRYDTAATIAEPILTSSQLTNSSNALSILLSAKLAGLENAETADTLLAKFFDTHEDKSAARRKALYVLSKFNMSKHAKKIAEEEFLSQPTEISIHNVLQATSGMDSPKANKAWVEKLWRTSASPAGSFAKLEQTQGLAMSPIYGDILEYLEKFESDSILAVERRAKWHYLAGDPQSGREHLQSFLSKHPDDAESHLTVLRFLDRWGLPGEIVSWATKDLDLESAPEATLQIGGLALQEIGNSEKAMVWFKKGMLKSAAPYRFATNTAETLTRRNEFKAAKALTDLALLKHPTRRRPYYVSAVAHIGLGDVKTATEHFDKSEFTDFPYSLFRTALRHDQVEFAAKLAKPFFTDRFSLENVGYVLREYVFAGKAKEGVKFVETHAPALVQNRGVPQTYARNSSNNTSDTLLWPIGDLYEAAGEKERAVEFIRATLEKTQYKDWSQISNPANSMAYKKATTNTNLDEGEKWIRLSLAFFPYYGKSGSAAAYIDTLGWVQYRQGKLGLAEKTIRRAILKQENGSLGPLRREVAQHELVAHLHEILTQLGKHREASVLDFRLRLLEKRDLNLRRTLVPDE